MNKLTILFSAAALTFTAVCSQAQTTSPVKDHLQNHFKFYGFIRNYAPFDTHESTAGTGDLYYWVPKDQDLNKEGVDLNERPSFRFLALTSRLGVDVSGYKAGNNEFGAKVEADFYTGLTGSTGTASLRLRQAYMTLKWTNPDDNKYSINFKAGQAWHPMAADLPDIFSLDSGMPFGPFSRTPQFATDFNFGGFSLTAAAIWQMQYTSAGPEGASANYIKYGCTPEFYFGLNYKKGGFLGRIGVDVNSIKPRSVATIFVEGAAASSGDRVKVKDRYTSVLGFAYLQYTKNLFKFKAKTVYGGGGEHINLMSGYAVSDISDNNDLWEYTPIRTSSTWVSLAYGKKVQGALFAGYVKNLGTSKDIVDSDHIFFQKNGSNNIMQMFRIQPEITYNYGKFTFGLEYMLTAAQYGKGVNERAISTTGLHWVMNHRIQALVKFTF